MCIIPRSVALRVELSEQITFARCDAVVICYYDDTCDERFVRFVFVSLVIQWYVGTG